MQEKNPMRRMWRLAEAEHGRLRLAIVLAALGVLAGMLPYFVVAKLVTTLLSRTAAGPRFYIFMCFAAFAGYTLRSLFYASALAVSHRAASVAGNDGQYARTVVYLYLSVPPRLAYGSACACFHSCRPVFYGVCYAGL